uniref:HTH psq-type domain-containing protein n=1 Tax=Electrophorus electricus TaxID=8005 RepID=A0AAY5F568_ELEEL
MPPKSPAPSKASGKEVKRPKATVTLQKKVELLDMLHEKKNFAAVACHYGINESMVHYIQKNEATIRPTVSSSFRATAKNVSNVKNKYIVKIFGQIVCRIARASPLTKFSTHLLTRP